MMGLTLSHLGERRTAKTGSVGSLEEVQHDQPRATLRLNLIKIASPNG